MSYKKRLLTEKAFDTPYIEEALNRHVEWVCRNVVSGRVINQDKRDLVSNLLAMFFQDIGYEVVRITCDETNNPPETANMEEIVLEASVKQVDCRTDLVYNVYAKYS